MVVYQCYGYDKKHIPLWLAWQHKQTTSLRELSSTDIVCCILVSNVTLLMISYLLFPVTGHSVYCFFLLHFLMFVREGALNLAWESIQRKTLLEHLPALKEADRMTPFAALELPSDKPLSLVCFCVLEWFNTQRVWEPVRCLKHRVVTLFFWRQVRIPYCGVNSNLRGWIVIYLKVQKGLWYTYSALLCII